MKDWAKLLQYLCSCVFAEFQLQHFSYNTVISMAIAKTVVFFSMIRASNVSKFKNPVSAFTQSLESGVLCEEKTWLTLKSSVFHLFSSFTWPQCLPEPFYPLLFLRGFPVGKVCKLGVGWLGITLKWMLIGYELICSNIPSPLSQPTPVKNTTPKSSQQWEKLLLIPCS